MQQSHELTLIIKAQKGDFRAFRMLVEANQGFAYAVAKKILYSEEDALDATQESFIKMWKNLKQFKHSFKLKTWLYRIVTNTCIDMLRATHNTADPLVKADSIVMEDLQYSEKRSDDMEMVEIVHSLLQKLPPIQKVVFVLRDIEGMSVTETAEILDYSPEIIKSNLYHARVKMREWLEKIYSE